LAAWRSIPWYLTGSTPTDTKATTVGTAAIAPV
jgi:hypothetical protein